MIGLHALNDSIPLPDKYMEKIIFLKKAFIGILTVWFLLCILPGDCLLLGCGEKDTACCVEKESTVLSHKDGCSSIPEDDPCCPTCCLLCAHNIVMHVFQNASFAFISTPSRLNPQPFNHHKNVFQTTIYHPPRLSA